MLLTAALWAECVHPHQDPPVLALVPRRQARQWQLWHHTE